MARKDDELKDVGKEKKGDRKLSALDRAILQALGDGRTVGLEEDPAREKFPEVWEWLTKTEEGGYVMQPASISIQLGPEGALITLTHRDLKTTCSVACPYVEQAFEALQVALSGPNPPIRTWGKDPQVSLRKKRPRS